MKKLFNSPFLTMDPKQEGMASIIVVGFLVVLLSLLSIGFTRIMDRSLQNASADQQSAAANYAAQSGINTVATWLQATYINKDNPIPPQNQLTPTCTNIFDASKFTPPVNPNIGQDTKLTCALVDATSSAVSGTLGYDIGANQSKVVKVQLTPGNSINSLKINWRSLNLGSNRNFANDNLQRLLTEADWNSIIGPSTVGNEPILRVSIYPISDTGDVTQTAAHSHTFFFYPQNSAAGGSIDVTWDKASPFSALWGSKCNAPPPGRQFDLSYFDCTVNLNGFPIAYSVGAEAYYMSIMPLYTSASVQLQLQGNNAQFDQGQTIIDVTAKSGIAVKRLRARVDLYQGDKSVPDFALRTADTICKRMVVYGPSNITQDGPLDQCYGPKTVTVTLVASPKNVSRGGSSTLTWTVTNATSCTASGGWSGAKSPLGGSELITNITFNTQFVIDCTNGASNASDSQWVTVAPSVDLPDLSGAGFAPIHVNLFAAVNPDGTLLNSCYFNFQKVNAYDLAPGPTTALNYRVMVTGSPNWTAGDVYGRTYYPICRGLSDSSTHYVYQQAQGWNGSSCSSSSSAIDGRGTAGNTYCAIYLPTGGIKHDVKTNSGDLVYFNFCVTYGGGIYSACSSDTKGQACGLMDKNYVKQGSGPYGKNDWRYYPHISWPCSTKTFRYFCDAAYHQLNPPGYYNAGYTYDTDAYTGNPIPRPTWCNNLF